MTDAKVFDPEALKQQYAHVKDENVKNAFIEMRLTMEKVAKVRQDLREKRTEKEDERPKIQAEREKFSQEIDKVQQEIELSRAKLMPSRAETLARQERSAKYDRKQVLLIKLDTFDTKLILERERVESHIATADKLNRQLNKAKEGGVPKGIKNVAQAKDKVANLTKKIGEADASGNANLGKLLAERAQLEKDVAKLEAIQDLEAELTAELEAAEACSPDVTLAEKEKMKEQLDKINEELRVWEDANPKPTPEDRKREDDRIKNIKASIDTLRAKKQEMVQKKETIGQSKEMLEAMDAIVKEKNELEKKIDEFEKKIPRTEFKVAENQSMYDIIGPGGSRMKVLESDFGCVIDLRRQEGTVVVRGTDCNDCAEAIQMMLEEEAKNRHEVSMTIDPDLALEFIGSKGSRIQMYQSTSGTTIDLERGTGNITVKGSEENIQKAVQMINEFKEASHKEVVNYPKALDSVLRPKIMKQWQDDYDVKNIRVNSAENTITILGKADNAKVASEEISSIINNMGDNTINIPSNVSHYAIIGTRGSRVMEIQDVTKCFIDVTETKVTVLGKKENIEEAKKLIDAIIKDNIREEKRIYYDTKMHNMLMRQRPIVQEEKHVDPEAENAEEEKAEEKKDERPPRTHECLLETLRKKHNCDRLQADLKTKTIFIRGPKDSIPNVEKELKEVLNFKGYARNKLSLDLPTVRWLTVNKQEEGKKGVVTRLDAIRAFDGIEEIIADFRAESKDVEVIGSQEAVDKATARLNQLHTICKAHSMTFEIEAFKVGRILGARGATRQEIEREYDVLVHCPARDDSLGRDAMATITVIGRDMANTEEACKRAQEASADYGPRD